VTSGPEPIDNIEWFKDNELIRSRPRFTQSSDGTSHTLGIRAIDCDDEGIYKCVLLNSWGIASCSAEVLVEGECSTCKFSLPFSPVVGFCYLWRLASQFLDQICTVLSFRAVMMPYKRLYFFFNSVVVLLKCDF